LLPDSAAGAAGDEITAEIRGDGRVTWRSARHGPLPVGGRTQSDLAATLAAAYGRTVLGA
jgi:hypothetical protein